MAVAGSGCCCSRYARVMRASTDAIWVQCRNHCLRLREPSTQVLKDGNSLIPFQKGHGCHGRLHGGLCRHTVVQFPGSVVFHNPRHPLTGTAACGHGDVVIVLPHITYFHEFQCRGPPQVRPLPRLGDKARSLTALPINLWVVAKPCVHAASGVAYIGVVGRPVAYGGWVDACLAYFPCVDVAGPFACEGQKFSFEGVHNASLSRFVTARRLSWRLTSGSDIGEGPASCWFRCGAFVVSRWPSGGVLGGVLAFAEGG